ncbi:MAG TPA: TIGR02530 family flagellar biosynthesis protein [Candidatus Deferrimicrobium sp.]|nr:TIGR02530 family flagellar biosynthesis protein [Candidatus Deferrimicrobium sp.]
MKINAQQQPVNLIEISQRRQPGAIARKPSPDSFQETFSRELAASHKLTFSRHAHERMYSRGITLSEENLNQVAAAIDKAQSKGSKETLVLTGDAAFVVSVVNRTVITAFDRDHLREGVVTSIDSAVIV